MEPVSLMSFVDTGKQWFKSMFFQAIASPEALIIEDAHLDERFKSYPLVVEEPKIRLYAGFQFQAHNDYCICTLWVIDKKPGNSSDKQP